MTSIEQWCAQQKQCFNPKAVDYSKPVACWNEPDVLPDNKKTDAFVVILRTKGCRWAKQSGCTMCGYFNDSACNGIDQECLLQQWQYALTQYNNQRILKVFTSGSFFDTEEISKAVSDSIVSTLPSSVKLFQVESRPEYVTSEIMTTVKNQTCDVLFQVGIGLESSNDLVRTYAINKGFSFKHYEVAANLLHKYSFLVKTYVLFKPLFLTEQEAITDAVTTIEDAEEYTDVFSVNPVTVQRRTLVEHLWKKNKYRPPWLWSIIQVLQQGRQHTKKRIQCDVTGGGSWRGPHNCKHCDTKVLEQIKSFSQEQKLSIFKPMIECSCYSKWLDQLDIEALTFGSIVDFSGDII